MEFRPHLSPVEMLEMGVFGGSYFERATDEDLEGLGAARCDPRTRSPQFASLK